jgi:hypothetical protein
MVAMTEGRMPIPDDMSDIEAAELTWLTTRQVVEFDGPCMFLSCLAAQPHAHAVCPTCGAVRFGNMFCQDCERYRGGRS